MVLLSSRMDNNMEQPLNNDQAKPGKINNNIEDLTGSKANDRIDLNFDQYINKCLSMIIHYDDVKNMAEIIKKIHNLKAYDSK